MPSVFFPSDFNRSTIISSMDLLIRGVYDAQTLETVQQLNVSRIGFDLRATSLNLIPFRVLKDLIPKLKTNQNFLSFENDSLETVNSFLSLLGPDKNKFELEFRDKQSFSYYAYVNHPFSWFFHPEGDWEGILSLPQLRTIVLPVKYEYAYQNLPKFWDMVQYRNLQVIVHVETFKDLELYVQEKNLILSVDLGRDFETSFRKIDQSRLSNLRIWRISNESATGQ